jgi:hypothetical protein
MEREACSGVKKAFKAVCARAGLKGFAFHDLRHCAINNLRLAWNASFKNHSDQRP